MIIDRPSLTLVRRLRAPPARVYAAWTNPELMARWWGPGHGPVLHAASDARVGGRFQVIFRTMDGEQHDCRGVYRDVIPDRRLVFTWSWVSTPERESLVTVELRPIAHEATGLGTELTLTHAQFFDEAARDGHRRGWSASLDKLVAFFEEEQAP